MVAYQTPDYWVDLYAVVSPLPELEAQARALGDKVVTEVVGAKSLESGQCASSPSRVPPPAS